MVIEYLSNYPDRDFVYSGTLGDDVLIGGRGNDIFTGSLGTDFIDGGGGIDTVVYFMPRAATDLRWESDGTITVAKPDGGRDTLINIERVHFSDAFLVFDLDSPNAAAAYRLYGGAFDRIPDEAGLRFWTNDWLDQGRTLADAAAGFIASAEFLSLYGDNLADSQFVEQLYFNVLGRPGEKDGIDFWIDYLGNGQGDRADVLVNFTQLPEYVGLSAADIDNGFVVI